MSQIKEETSDDKSGDQRVGTQRSTLSFKDRIALREKWRHDMSMMYYDIKDNCERKCQETEDDKPCDIYRKMRELHKENEGHWGERRSFD